NRLLYVGIARNLEGFRQLNELLSDCSLLNQPLPDIPPPMPDTFIVYEMGKEPKPAADFTANELMGVRPHQVAQLYSSEARRFPEKLVVFSPVTFLDAMGFGVHKLLRASALNKLGTQLTTEDLAHPNEKLFPPDCFPTFYN